MVPRVNAPSGVFWHVVFFFYLRETDGGIMSTIEEQLKALREETLASLKQITAENKKEMQDLRVSVLGKRVRLRRFLKE